MKFLEKIKDLWTRFRTWQIGECTDPAGMGNMQISNEFFKGTVHSTMPIFDGVTANTALQLLFRPGYMIREYLRGKHDNVLSPMAALIIFFAFGMILNNMFGSEPVNYSEVLTQAQERLASEENVDDPAIVQKAILLLDKISAVYRFFNMDQFPDTIHTRTERVIAGIEDWIRSQGVFTFIARLLLLTLGLWSVGHKSYRLSYSAAATIAAFILCQRCIYEFFFTLFSLGTHHVPLWLVFLLLWLNIYQLLGVSWKKSLGYTVSLAVTMFAYLMLFLAFFGAFLILYTYIAL